MAGREEQKGEGKAEEGGGAEKRPGIQGKCKAPVECSKPQDSNFEFGKVSEFFQTNRDSDNICRYRTLHFHKKYFFCHPNMDNIYFSKSLVFTKVALTEKKK